MKKLKIKGQEEEETNEIELVRGLGFVAVHINGEHVASFSNDGEFRFYGQEKKPKYVGRWDE